MNAGVVCNISSTCDDINLSDSQNIYGDIPPELKEKTQWVVWKREFRDGKSTKIPLNPQNLSYASTNKPPTWSTFNNAVTAYQTSGDVDGIGFVFTKENGYIAIDFDHAVDENGEINEEIAPFLTLCNSYGEISQSGAGIHIIVKGRIPDGWNNRTEWNGIGIEAYDHGRYFVFTGNHIDSTPLSINPVTEKALRWLGLPLKRGDATPTPPSQPGLKTTILDEHVIELCKTVRGVLWSRLYDDGDLSDFDDDHSKADYAFCCMVAEQTRDPNQIERIFRLSGLHDRTKWGEGRKDSTYGKITVKRAIANTPLIIIPASEEDDHEAEKPVPLMLRPNLEAENFVNQYIDVCSERTSSYPEYHFANALTALSIVSDRRISINTFTTTVYPNLFQFCFGQSSVSKKSTALGYLVDLVTDVYPYGKIPEEFSPQSFIEMLSLDPHSYFCHDEASKFFSAIKKRPNMAEAREIILSLYDNKSYRKRLTAKKGKNAQQSEWNVPEPFLNINFVSTIEATSRVVDEEDFTSGLMPRFLMYYPTYDIPTKPLGEATEDNFRKVGDLQGRYTELSAAIANHPAIRFRLSRGGWDVYNNWEQDQTQSLRRNPDEMTASIFSRYSVIVLKIAMLFTVGSQEFLRWAREADDIAVGELEYHIPDAYVEEAIRQMDGYFIPVALDVRKRITEITSSNLGLKIVRILREKGETVHAELMRRCNLYRENKSSWHFKNALETLLESQEILVKEEEKVRSYRINPRFS